MPFPKATWGAKAGLMSEEPKDRLKARGGG
jgi:hypothetical protein